MRFRGLVVLVLLCVALSPAEAFDCGLKKLEACIAATKTRGPAPAGCEKLTAYLAERPLHWEGDSWFLDREKRIKAELRSRGISVDGREAIADFVAAQVGPYEVVGLFKADRLIFVAGMVDRELYKCWDPGAFPFSSVTVYSRLKGKARWKNIGSFTADSRVPVFPQNDWESLGKWFPLHSGAVCPTSDRLFKASVGICFTDFLKTGRPEVHVFVDHLASIGIRRESRFWDGKGWAKLDNGNGALMSYKGKLVRVNKLSAMQEGWGEAAGGVKVYDPKTKKWEWSEDLTREILRPREEILGYRNFDGAPASPGFFCKGTQVGNGYESYCLEFKTK